MAENTSQNPSLPFPHVDACDLKLKHPFTMMTIGPSGCGKTTFILALIKERKSVISPPPDRVIYAYKTYQKAFDKVMREAGDVEFVQGLNFTTVPGQRTLLLLDDLMLESLPLGHLFTVRSHHESISVIYVAHNLFHQSPEFRLAALNTNYYALFASIRGLGQVNYLAKQIFAHQKDRQRKMISAYVDATKKPFSYLFLDLRTETSDALRLRADILPQEGFKFRDCALTKAYPL